MPTQGPTVPSFIPSSFATRAIGRDVSITILTASSLNSGEKLFFARGNYFTFPDVHPIGWTVRKPRGTSVVQPMGPYFGRRVLWVRAWLGGFLCLFNGDTQRRGCLDYRGLWRGEEHGGRG